MSERPADLGFRWPAEWDEHAATWIAWPHQRADWPGKFAAIPWVFAEIVRHLHRSEPVGILAPTEAAVGRIRGLLARCGIDLERVQLVVCPTDRCWLRDSGPIFVRSLTTGEVAVTAWGFNAWAKYVNWRLDAKVPDFMQRHLRLKGWRPCLGARRVVLEGGSIDGNGRGCLLTTEQCLLSDVQARNPGFRRQDYERVFADYLGASKVLWLGRGIVGDDTHGHVDDVARFVGPRTVVAALEDDPRDDNYGPLRENFERLQGMADQEGRKLEVVPLPMPEPVWFAGQRLPASYVNFYIANQCVLVPTFNDPRDRKALGILSELFPERKVVGIHAVDLVWGLGTLHCLTQQQPLAGGLATPPAGGVATDGGV
ncbi:MAG: agmatine deiminase family protein, partial [Gemmataceae bacterium]|nr:agmatine deiminase family protein [Gemmataceae bacterium]MDW8264290.1 agmatine deiminase family protein [Gemmataceae bacterium]